MKTSTLVLVCVVVVSVLSIITLNSITGQVSRPRTIEGDIADARGLPVYDNWEQSLSMVVATDEFGNIIGWGPLESSKWYYLMLRSGWELPLHINLGFYDPYKPDRTRLTPCTTLHEIERWTNIECDLFESDVRGGYR